MFKNKRTKHLFILALVTYMGFALSSCVTNNKSPLSKSKSDDFSLISNIKFEKYKICTQELYELLNQIHKKGSYNSSDTKLINEKIKEKTKLRKDLQTYIQKSLDIKAYEKFKNSINASVERYGLLDKKIETSFTELLNALSSIIKESDKNLGIEMDKVIIEYAEARKSMYNDTPSGIYQVNYALSKLTTLFEKVNNENIKVAFLSARKMFLGVNHFVSEAQGIEQMNTLKNIQSFVSKGKE